MLQAAMAAVPLDKFVPFGFNQADNEVPANDDSFVFLDLQYEMPFFGTNYKRLWVDNNGGFSFNGGVNQYTPTCTPLTNNMRMVMVFWADVMTFPDDIFGKVYYREDHNPALLQSLAHDIIQAYPAFWDLRLSSAVVATWFNVSFFQVESGCYFADHNEWPRNTFQAILATDETRTFAIFNYNKVVWTTGTASHGNCSGLGGIPARVGFDASDGKNYITIEDSCKDSIVNVADKSNVGIPGKFIFRIDNTDIDIGECNNIKYTNEKLLVTPKFVDTWGQVPITLEGPCFNETHNLTCIFHDSQKGQIEVPAIFSEVSVAAICLAPYLYGIGRITVGLRVTYHNQTDEYSGFLYVVNPNPSINVTTNSTSLSIFWDRAKFANYQNLIIRVVKYGLPGPQWYNSIVISNSTPNTGSFSGPLTFNLSENDINFVYAVVVETSEEQRNFRDRIFGFSDYFTAPVAEVLALGKNILNSMCDSWYRSDPGPPTNLLPCPPTLRQARLDVRFVDDGQSPASIAFFHPGGFKSFRSRSPNDQGHGQQCVYDNQGNNMVGPFGGGTADWVSPESSYLGHFFKDVLPWLGCCKPGDLAECQKYYNKRPSDSGSNYVAPAMGRGNGDPHIATFDLAEYTFNGAGEFWMIKNLSANPTLQMQGRTQVYGGNATVFTAFAFQQPAGSKLQVSLSGTNSLVVLLDDYPLELHDPQLWTQNFLGATLSRNEDPSSVSISFMSGFDFVISAANNTLSITAAANLNNHRKVAGLLGYFDGDKQNDLRTPDGKIISADSNLTDIHFQFGLKWMITETESLFLYTEGKNFSSYNNPNYLPNLQEPNPTELPQEVRDACNASRECFYDYVATGNIQFALSTKQTVDAFNQTVDDVKASEVVVCPSISNDIHTIINGTNYNVNATLVFSCLDGYHLIGTKTITCTASGSWSFTPPICEIDSTTGPSTTSLPTTTTALPKTTTALPTTTTALPATTTVLPTTKGSTTVKLCSFAMIISVVTVFFKCEM